MDHSFPNAPTQQSLNTVDRLLGSTVPSVDIDLNFTFPSSTTSVASSVPMRTSPNDQKDRQSPGHRAGPNVGTSRWVNPNLDLSQYLDPGDLALKKDLAKAPFFHNYPSTKDGVEADDGPSTVGQVFERDDPGMCPSSGSA